MTGKLSSRPFMAITNILRYFLIPLGNIVMAFIVKERQGHELWGSFVEFLIISSVLSAIMQWGAKEHLLREFSLTPKRMKNILANAILSRSFLLLLISPGLFFLYDAEIASFIVLWLVGLLLQAIFESLVLYYRNLLIFTFIDLIIITATGYYLWHSAGFSLVTLIKVFAIQALVKGGITALYYIKYLSFKGKLNPWTELKLAFPLFLIGLSGMLFSKVDIWVVNGYEEDDVISKYQIFMTCLIYLQALGGYGLMPFQKLLYRLKRQSIKEISLKFGILGFFISVLGVAATWILLISCFEFSPDLYILPVAVVFVWPVFYTLPIIHHLYSIRKEKAVLVFNLIGFILNGVLTLLLVPVYGYEGAIVTTAFSQLVSLLCYVVYFNRLNHLAVADQDSF